VIEQTQDGEYALVFKRYGDRPSSMKIVKAHRADLEGTGIRVSFIRENNNDVVYGEASFLHEAFEKDPPPTKTVQKIDSDLEQKIENLVGAKRKEGRLASDEATSWSVYDFTSNTKLVTINEDIPRQAASMIKPFIALAFFHEAQKGTYIYGPKTRVLMERMIQRSSNSSTNKLIDLLGGPSAVNQLLRGNYASIFKQTRIVERIPPGGRTYRNLASAHDYSRFLYSLWKAAPLQGAPQADGTAQPRQAL
jgi:beta-lactamase class A